VETLSKIAKGSLTGTRLTRGMSFGFGMLRRHLWVWPLLAAAMLAVAGLGIRSYVESAAQMEMSEGLTAILESNVEALHIWFGNEKAQAVAAASDVEIRRLSRELKKLADSEPDRNALVQSPLQDDFRLAMRPLLTGKGHSGYVLLDKNRLILASDRPELIGQIRQTPYDLVGRTVERGSIVTPPIPSATVSLDKDGQLRAGQPTMFAMATQRDLTGEVVGVLGLRIKPDEDFARILQIARPGNTGETYAFDKNGLMLSESRFTQDLIRIALIPDQPGARSQLNVSVRDPGVNMMRGGRPAKTRADQPLTLMAASAIQGKDGVNVAGYRDYRGVPVIGAWTWLKDYDMGVATEKDVAEAYRSLYILRRAFWGLFGLLAASSLLIAFFSLAMVRVQRAAQRASLAAKELGQYQLEEKLGEGGMGVVYRGRHKLLRRPTAIKLLHPDKSTDESVARFEREVQLTCQLNHPNTISIFDYGRTPEGLFFYAMEYLDGINLETLVSRYGPQPEGRVIHILEQICGSLAEAHEICLVHRDIKPANVILNRRGGESDVVKVLDFGLVKAMDANKTAGLTSANAVLGTPLYMSPEAVETPDSIDARSDLYAVAAVGYYLLTGTPVFSGKSVVEICMNHVHMPPVRPSDRLGKPISADVEAALLKGLEKKPADRYPTAREFSDALLACASARLWTRREAAAWWNTNSSGIHPTPSGPTTSTVHQEQTLVMAADGLPQ
jgi:serine/threonine protein kinase